MKEEKCFPFFFDWIEPFSTLDGEEFKKLVLAMLRYYKYGKKPPKFNGTTSTIAMFVFSQLDRTKKNKENGKRGGNPSLKKEKIGSTHGSTTTTNTTTSNTTNTTTSTTTNFTKKETDRFDAFWKKYPKKMNMMKSLNEFILLNLSDSEYEYMMSQLENHIKSVRWRNEQYVPLPENYLKNKKWTDELEMDESSFDADDFFEAAVARSKRIIAEGITKN